MNSTRLYIHISMSNTNSKTADNNGPWLAVLSSADETQITNSPNLLTRCKSDIIHLDELEHTYFAYCPTDVTRRCIETYLSFYPPGVAVIRTKIEILDEHMNSRHRMVFNYADDQGNLIFTKYTARDKRVIRINSEKQLCDYFPIPDRTAESGIFNVISTIVSVTFDATPLGVIMKIYGADGIIENRRINGTVLVTRHIHGEYKIAIIQQPYKHVCSDASVIITTICRIYIVNRKTGQMYAEFDLVNTVHDKELRNAQIVVCGDYVVIAINPEYYTTKLMVYYKSGKYLCTFNDHTCVNVIICHLPHSVPTFVAVGVLSKNGVTQLITMRYEIRDGGEHGKWVLRNQ